MQFVAEFRDLLKRSVKLHLVSDVPLAAMCSGGVDSSLIAAYAKDEMPGIQAYVADILGPLAEGDQAARVARHLEIPLRRIVVDQARFLRLWPHTVWHSDTPPISPSDSALLAVVQACRAEGMKVLLTGEGADELFGGYSWQQATYNNWLQLSSWKRYFLPDRGSRKLLRRTPFSLTSESALNRRIVAFDTDGELRFARLIELLARVKPEADRAFLAHCFYNLMHDYLPWILHRHDRIGMAASIEMRVPFLENELLDFAFHLPRRAKFHRKTGKWLIKQAAAQVLPSAVVYAPKKGFPSPKEFSLGTQRLLAGGMVAEFMQWPAGTTQEIIAILGGDAPLRFHLVGLELWFRMFFGGEALEGLGDKLIDLADGVALSTKKCPHTKGTRTNPQ